MASLQREWRKAKEAHRGRHKLLDHAELLEPGLWVFSGWELWFKAGRKLPAHLLHSKGNRRGPLLYRLVKMLVSPLYWVWVPRGRGAGKYFAAVKGPSVKREVILFSGHSVCRVVGRPRDPDQVRLRALWDAHVTNSAVIESETTERYFVEQLVPDGPTAAIAGVDKQITAVNGVFSQYASLLAKASQGRLADYRDDIEPRLFASAHYALIRRAIDIVGEEGFWRLGVVPTGSDSSPDNAIISPEGVAYFVDTEPVYVRPAICHPLGVIAGWDQKTGVLVDRYLAGAFDDLLSPLLPEGSESSGLDIQTRMAWLVLAILTPVVTPPVVRRKIRPLDHVLDEYGLTQKAHRVLGSA